MRNDRAISLRTLFAWCCAVASLVIGERPARADEPATVSFTNDVMPILGKAGCNTGACHGHASGKGGFKLSLRGYNPAADHLALSRDQLTRRIDPLVPENSLLLRKPAGQTSHGGGRRFEVKSASYAMFRRWLAEGAQSDVGQAVRIERIEVTPAERLVAQPGLSQQLTVRAHFADKSVRDVTDLAIYELTNDDGIARVEPSGLVTTHREGETAVLVRFLGRMALARFTVIRQKPDFKFDRPSTNNFIDALVYDKLAATQVQPAALTSDAEFLRRVSLDTIGLLPEPADLRAFLADARSDKRARKIDELLARDEFGLPWAQYWLDLSGASEGGASAGRRGLWNLTYWLRDAVNRNLPYDQFVTTIVTAQGSAIDNPPVLFALNLLPQSEVTSQLFLATRLQCAQCHDHPFDVWTQRDYNELTGFFTHLAKKDGPHHYTEGEVFVAPERFLPWERDKRTSLRLLDGSMVELPATADRRVALATWMFGPAKKWTARAIVNRVWGKLLGRGIVEPVDDMRFSNPPGNPQLLDALADDFIAHAYDFKQLVRLVLNSRTYQLSSTPHPTSTAGDTNFSHAFLRRLPAEQLLDVISQATGVEEAFRGAPAGLRAQQLAVLGTGSRFLETFGRPTRRATPCTCERTADTSLPQILHLLNGETLERKLRAPEGMLVRLLAGQPDADRLIEELYLHILSRLPTASERQLASEYFATAADRPEGAHDLAWALLNSQEFLFNH